MSTDIAFRSATLADAEILWSWRNDPETRRMAGNATRIGWSEYVAWLKASLSDPRREIFVATADANPVGTLRCDHWDTGQEITWTVAPEWRGRGIGKRMVAEFCRRREARLRARIRPHNHASRHVAAHAGMQPVAQQRRVALFEKPFPV